MHVIDRTRNHDERDSAKREIKPTAISCSTCGATAALMVESILLYRTDHSLAHIEYSCLKCDCVYTETIDRTDLRQIFLGDVPLRDLRGTTLAHCGEALKAGQSLAESTESGLSGFEILRCRCGFQVELNYFMGMPG
ncbi:hypothetical protein UM93_13055 [Psychromicrobium lacuslunae]|uniref:Uncharacterized protein n=1 Tax=Psychromicrobium lacuslunae TaxID=1618207 RepID=A0A0D4C0W7_9MICC|nr:hypothetical protein UM93_13055 [Psychromicrobium lacuslunae]